MKCAVLKKQVWSQKILIAQVILLNIPDQSRIFPASSLTTTIFSLPVPFGKIGDGKVAVMIAGYHWNVDQEVVSPMVFPAPALNFEPRS